MLARESYMNINHIENTEGACFPLSMIHDKDSEKILQCLTSSLHENWILLECNRVYKRGNIN